MTPQVRAGPLSIRSNMAFARWEKSALRRTRTSLAMATRHTNRIYSGKPDIVNRGPENSKKGSPC